MEWCGGCRVEVLFGRSRAAYSSRWMGYQVGEGTVADGMYSSTELPYLPSESEWIREEKELHVHLCGASCGWWRGSEDAVVQ